MLYKYYLNLQLCNLVLVGEHLKDFTNVQLEESLQKQCKRKHHYNTICYTEEAGYEEVQHE